MATAEAEEALALAAATAEAPEAAGTLPGLTSTGRASKREVATGSAAGLLPVSAAAVGALGAALGAMFDNLAMGIAIGVAIGVALGAALGARKG